MRIAFAGTPEFAAVALRRLVAEGFDVALVLTQPDRPAGRGMKLQASPVKAVAQAHAIPVVQPRSLRLDGKYPDEASQARDALQSAGVQALVVAAYGLILPAWVLDLPPRGCLNIHGSLLPRWRGAAPIQRAIEAGDAETGITIMQMDTGLDTGDMLLAERLAIGADDSTATLHDRLADVGARLVVQALRDAEAGRGRRTPQPALGVTYAHKIDKAEAAVDWRAPAVQIERRMRAFDPFPGLHFRLGDETVKLWRARVVPATGSPASAPPAGTASSPGPGRLVVACGDGALELLEIQRAGGKRQSAAALLQARPDLPGTALPSASPAAASQPG